MILRFADVSLDDESRELVRDGVTVHVEPQVFDLILLLARNAERVVTTDEILDAVWDGRAVSDAAVASRINAARKALGDNGTDQRVIRTLRGRGFRFCLTPETAAAPAPPRAPLSDTPSIAVLPFAVLPADAEVGFFADGIVEDLIGALSRFRDLSVIGRNTAFALRDDPGGAQAIGASLGVKYVLSGSVRHAGGRVRVSVELMDTATARALWSDRYDRTLDDAFTVQDEITRRAVSQIAPQTQYAEMTSAHRKGTASLSAWEQVMRARWHMDKHDRQDTDTALALLAETARQDPDIALLHGTAAACHLHRMLNAWCDDPLTEIGLAEAAARRAVALDANDSAALAIMGLAAMFRHRFDESLDLLDEATRRNPNLASGYGFLATVHGCLGNTDRSLENGDTALALSPRDPLRTFWMSGKGIALFLGRQYDGCIDNAEVMLRIQPGYGPALRQRAASLAMLDRPAEAAETVGRILSRMPGLTVDRVRQMVPVRDPADADHWLGALRRAGLPD